MRLRGRCQVLATLVNALALWMHRVCAVRLPDTISDFRWKNLRVGADRRVRPRVSMFGWLMVLRMPGVGDLGECACAVDASRMCRGRRMLREIR